MFQELMPLIANRPLSITVAAISGGQIRVNVVPLLLEKDSKVNEKIGYSSKDKIVQVPEASINALTTPLSLTGTPEEIDAGLLQSLTEFTQSHVRLQSAIDEAKEEIAGAVKAIEERDKNKTRTKTSPTTTQREEPKKPASDDLPLLWCKPASSDVAVSANDEASLPLPSTPASSQSTEQKGGE
jgi:PRTRC genetic system protein E